jgi:signal transduction histidine kinase
MEIITAACHDQMRLINDILAFAQLDSGRVAVQLSAVPAHAAIDRAATLLRLRAEEAGLKLSIESCERSLAVHADADRLQQVLLNLLTNAIKFTPAGGNVTVACACEGEQVRIRICDTGVGIPQEQLERIFDPFVQLEHQPDDPSHRGVGLGLAISRELTRAMEGELTAESTPGGGSVFTVTLAAESVESAPLQTAR